MPRATPCPGCGLPFNQRWIQIASSVLGDDAVPSFICPRCTMGRVGLSSIMDLPTAYGVRGLPGEIDISGAEHPDSGAFLLGPEQLAASLRRRLSDVGLAVQVAKAQAVRAGEALEARPTLLHVASGEGALLSLAARKFELEVLGLEPWTAWYQRAKQAQVPTLDLAPELIDAGRQHDVIVEHHLLMRVPDPRAHLRSLVRRLSAHGVLVIEVPNLLAAPRLLQDGYLSVTRPHLFTARALRNLLHKVGLVPIQVFEGTELRIFARHRAPHETAPRVAEGLRVRDAIETIHGNELRIKLKRGLAQRGPSSPLVTMAEKILAASSFPPVKADLCIEVAKALERHHDHGAAARWLRRSLEHRSDADVACMAVRCEMVARARAVEMTPVPGDYGVLFSADRVGVEATSRN